VSDGQVQAFWREHYEELGAKGPRWLDYSNERTQAQTLALALEAAGPLDGREVLDVGCGHGQLSLAARGLGARRVVGVDVAASCVERNARLHPDIQWIAASVLSMEPGGPFDVVFAIEVLQYAPLAEALRGLWGLLRPGGRLVAVVPYAGCPIVRRVSTRFEGRYAAASVPELQAALEALPDLGGWQVRGLSFREDQAFCPYEATAWTTAPAWPAAPNRLQLVARRAERQPGLARLD
jgi:SAM-dependent methyltransferase